MAASIEALAALLSQLNIDCEKVTHPPLATASAADEIALHRPGMRLKNLFLRDNYGRRHFLLITAHNAQVDLKALSKAQRVSRLGFASDERLLRYLGVRPGCVSMLALMNDPQQQVELWLDEAIWADTQDDTLYHCHPFDNEQTWLLPKTGLNTLFGHWQRQPLVLPVAKRCGSTIKP
ncbi:prolyl-tRNA synthetase associated domain-containing protein [Pseudoalteromonas sp. T1lg48]|uniref:prolyl-tRNA synthetase associated domain-containing protein n=1 Tax=Pseudoalteromonas sp. T1lg48 TaxID=2077100 RepID=UPI000CF67765|nr:prolyl-tRNA synthetase associated domain-containing protein [Pseudoalteromonas sp. T1lg48]